MQSAGYFRDQAALCLEIAQLMSDPHTAENLRAAAAEHFARATELERLIGTAALESHVAPLTRA
jgi:hypothetical protein